MRITDFDLYRDLIREKSGLHLTPDQSYMLDSRLGPVAKKWGYLSLEAMTGALHGVPDKNLVSDIIEAVTFNDTSFFRDAPTFNMLRDIALPYLVKKRANKKIRIWCAGASSGQEAYSAALTIMNKNLAAGWKTEILATDISNEAIEMARNGVYSQHEVQRGLPIRTVLKYFTQDGTTWEIHDALKKMVKFDYFNLLDNPKKLGAFDIIFCRNVLSFFDDPLKKSVLEKLAGQMEKDGFLFLGKTESSLGLTELFKPMAGIPGAHAFTDSAHHAASGLASARISA